MGSNIGSMGSNICCSPFLEIVLENCMKEHAHCSAASGILADCKFVCPSRSNCRLYAGLLRTVDSFSTIFVCVCALRTVLYTSEASSSLRFKNTKIGKSTNRSGKSSKIQSSSRRSHSAIYFLTERQLFQDWSQSALDCTTEAHNRDRSRIASDRNDVSLHSTYSCNSPREPHSQGELSTIVNSNHPISSQLQIN